VYGYRVKIKIRVRVRIKVMVCLESAFWTLGVFDFRSLTMIGQKVMGSESSDR